MTLLATEWINQRIRQILGKLYLLSLLSILLKSQEQGQKSFINTMLYADWAKGEKHETSLKLINLEKFWFLSHFMNKLGKTLHGIKRYFPARTVTPSSKAILQPETQKAWCFDALRHASWHIVHKEQKFLDANDFMLYLHIPICQSPSHYVLKLHIPTTDLRHCFLFLQRKLGESRSYELAYMYF